MEHFATRRAGFTIVELLIAVALLGLALSGAAMVSRSGSEVHRTSVAVQDVEQRLHRALEQVSGALTTAGADYLVPTPVEGLAYGSLQFQQVIGHTGTTPDLGPTIELATEIEGNEADNGADDDGDGLVDERELVLTLDVGGANEQRVKLVSGVLELLEGESSDGLDENGNGLVDEPGFHLERNGDVVAVRLSIGDQDPQGRLVVRTAELDIRMRN